MDKKLNELIQNKHEMHEHINSSNESVIRLKQSNIMDFMILP